MIYVCKVSNKNYQLVILTTLIVSALISKVIGIARMRRGIIGKMARQHRDIPFHVSFTFGGHSNEEEATVTFSNKVDQRAATFVKRHAWSLLQRGDGITLSLSLSFSVQDHLLGSPRPSLDGHVRINYRRFLSRSTRPRR